MTNEEIKHPEAEEVSAEQQAEQATEASAEQTAEEAAAAEETPAGEGAEKDWDDPDNMDDALKLIAALQLQLRETIAQRDQAKEMQLRLNADFDNFRKRKNKEMADSIRFANQELLIQLLPILDNFDRTLDAIEKTDNLAAVKDGIAVVNKSMRNTFQKVGLEPVASVGKALDPEVHEVITTVPVPEDDKKGMVIDEVEKGYKLKDRVIRVAKVIVGE